MDCSLSTTEPNPSARTFNAGSPAFRAGNSGVSPKALPLREAIELHSGLKTVMDVLCGLMCQPRFLVTDGLPNAAGDELDDVWEDLGRRVERLVTIIRSSRPNDETDRRKRAAFLATYEIESDGDEADRLTDAFMTSPA